MLLEVQAEGPHSSRLQETAEEVLLLVRQKRGAYQRLSPTILGNAARIGEDAVATEPLITYQPRPHITVTFQQRSYEALIDSGSERSFINAEVIRQAESLGYHVRDQLSTIYLANNLPIEVPGVIRLSISVGNRRFSHKFLIMPSLKTPMLIGVDLWAKIGITLGPPSPPTTESTDRQPSRIPPAVKVILPTGRIAEIPHFAVFRSRKYKLRLPGERWILRFDRCGRLNSCRRA